MFLKAMIFFIDGGLWIIIKIIFGTTIDLVFYYTMSDGRRLIPESLNVTHTWVDIRLLNGIKTPRKVLFSVQ